MFVCVFLKRKRTGSVLIWAMVVVMVMVIVSAIGLSLAQAGHQKSVTGHTENQAYHTAMSAAGSVAEWVVSGGGNFSQGSAGTFLQDLDIAGGEKTIDFTQADLPENTGACTVRIRYTDDTRKGLLITATAAYQGATELVEVVMSKSEGSFGEFAFPVADGYPAEYDAEAAALNGVSTEGFVDDYAKRNAAGVVLSKGDTGFGAAYGLGRWLGTRTSAPYNHVDDDKNVVSQVVASPDSGIEATFAVGQDEYHTGTHDWEGNRAGHPKAAEFVGSFFVTGMNGRMAINPEKDVTHAVSNSATATFNSKLNNFSVDELAGKPQIKIRLTEESGAGKSDDFLNAFVNLDFTDNAGVPEETVADRDGNSIFSWHPQNWNGARLFTRGANLNAGEAVDVNLIFGPYLQRYDTTLADYTGSCLYRNKWIGNEPGALYALVPNLESDGTDGGSAKRGMPVVPVTWGHDMGIYLLDAPASADKTAKRAWIMQGVNIIDGTIYSYRGLDIGGALTSLRGQSAYMTAENVNNTVTGFQSDDPTVRVSYAMFTALYNQTIADTDIILLGTAAKPVESVIKRPSVLPMRRLDKSEIADWSKFQNRRVSITGGSIYVGANHSLRIEGVFADGTHAVDTGLGVTTALAGSKNPRTEATYKDYLVMGQRLNVAPDRITVAAGGSLTIEASAYTTVDTDIYVEGVLTIKAGAKIRGNIYCYGGGKLVVEGSFTLDCPHGTQNGTEDAERGGVYVYGQGTAARPDGTILSAGQAEIAANTVVSGTSGKIHFLGLGDAFEEHNHDGYACAKRNMATGRCEHFGGDVGWHIVQYSQGGNV